MNEIGIYEAKTHLSSLLKWVENGESFSITNQGKVVAVVLLPPDDVIINTNEAYTK